MSACPAAEFPPDVAGLLGRLRDQLAAREYVVGVYVYNSLFTDDYSPAASDIDVILLVRREPGPAITSHLDPSTSRTHFRGHARGGGQGGGGGIGMFRAAMPASMAATTDSTTLTLAQRLSSASISTQGAASWSVRSSMSSTAAL